MGKREDIQAYYTKMHNALNKKYYIDHTITKIDFETQHGALWNQYPIDLLRCGAGSELLNQLISTGLSDITAIDNKYYLDQSISKAQHRSQRKAIFTGLKCFGVLINNHLLKVIPTAADYNRWMDIFDAAMDKAYQTVPPDMSDCNKAVDVFRQEMLTNYLKNEDWVEPSHV